MARLSAHFPEIKFEVHPITTGGDKIQDRPIAAIGGRGVFVKELEEALMQNRVDLVVHSLKDLPTDLPTGLKLACVLDRSDPRDVLVSEKYDSLAALPAGATVATSSRRRAAQLLAQRPDLKFVDMRGNIPTRLRKLQEGQCDAMILAAAGLLRLNFADKIKEYLSTETSTSGCRPGRFSRRMPQSRRRDTVLARVHRRQRCSRRYLCRARLPRRARRGLFGAGRCPRHCQLR